MGTPDTEAWVASHLTTILHGQAARAAAEITTQADQTGAYRHLIGDRLDITGSRWGLTSAEALLKLRALIDNDHFYTYWQPCRR
ncbi:hypothetical protein [Streptomyces sp. NBC_00827]|uniref:hypothetical protein n=1 Tax=Streptomyces sp. NBC_00827 TaxID=2903677 RepID=UPI003868B410